MKSPEEIFLTVKELGFTLNYLKNNLGIKNIYNPKKDISFSDYRRLYDFVVEMSEKKKKEQAVKIVDKVICYNNIGYNKLTKEDMVDFNQDIEQYKKLKNIYDEFYIEEEKETKKEELLDESLHKEVILEDPSQKEEFLKQKKAELDALRNKYKKSIAQLCKERGLKIYTFYSRVYNFGWDVEEALNRKTGEKKLAKKKAAQTVQSQEEKVQTTQIDDNKTKPEKEEGVKSLYDRFCEEAKTGKKLYTFCIENHLNYSAIFSRVYISKWDLKRAIETPIFRNSKGNYLLSNEQFKNMVKEEIGDIDLIDLCKKKGVKYNTIKARVRKYGWTVKDALEKPIGECHRFKNQKIQDTVQEEV